MDIAELTRPRGRALLDSADRLLETAPDRAAVLLRRETDDAELAAAALTQANLRRQASAKFGEDAAGLFFTRDGLEQASRAEVAARRAARITDTGARHIADLCCGIGADAIALARAGGKVTAVDADAGTGAIAAANARALDLDITVRQGDALEQELSGMDAAFADPARRRAGKRVFDPSAYQPPLEALWTAMAAVPLRVCKVGPGIRQLPTDAEAEWVSVDGAVVEAALWGGDLAQVARRASLLRGGGVHELTGSGTAQAPVGAPGDYVYEPDGAVIRAHLVAELAQLIDGRLAHPDIAYLYTDAPVDTPFATGYRIEEVLSFHVKKLRGLVRQRGVGNLTIKKRGADVDPDRLRRDLKPSGAAAATIVVTRAAGRHVALWCHPV